MISIYVLKIIEHITEIRRKAPVAFDEKRNSFALLELLINACDVCITNIKLIRGLFGIQNVAFGLVQND